MQNITSDKIERLIFIKHLLHVASSQQKLERPLSSTCILTMHDLIECFLQLGFEQLTGKHRMSGNNILDTYAEEINKILLATGSATINKGYIRRLNDHRNQLKHTTIFIDSKNIKNLFSETETFIQDFCKVIFDLEVDMISMTLLLQDGEIKSWLAEAEIWMWNGEHHLAMINISKAFHLFIGTASEVSDPDGRSLLKASTRPSYRWRNTYSSATPIDPEIKRNFEEIAKDIEAITQDFLEFKKVHLLSFDFREYLHFKELAPVVRQIRKSSGNDKTDFIVPKEAAMTNTDFTKEETNFAFDFVLFAALSYHSKLTK